MKLYIYKWKVTIIYHDNKMYTENIEALSPAYALSMALEKSGATFNNEKVKKITVTDTGQTVIREFNEHGTMCEVVEEKEL